MLVSNMINAPRFTLTNFNRGGKYMNGEIIFAKYKNVAKELQTWLLPFTAKVYVTLYYYVAKPYTVVRKWTTNEIINIC